MMNRQGGTVVCSECLGGGVVVVAHASEVSSSSSECESQRASRRRLAGRQSSRESDSTQAQVRQAGFVVNGWAEAVRLRKVGQLYHRACAWEVARDGLLRCDGTGLMGREMMGWLDWTGNDGHSGGSAGVPAGETLHYSGQGRTDRQTGGCE